MDASRLERAAFEAWYASNRDDGPNMVLSRSMAEKAWFARAALDAAPEPAQEPVDALCLFCRTELDLDEMDDGSDLPPLAPGVCSECFQRWHDEPVWRKRLKEATYPPAPDAALLERVARLSARIACELIAGNHTLLTADAVDAIVDQAARQALAEAEAGRAGTGAAPSGGCPDCDAKHPRYVVPSRGDVIHTLPGGQVILCARAHPAPATAAEVRAAAREEEAAAGHVHDWDYDCRGNGPFCKLCGVGPA